MPGWHILKQNGPIKSRRWRQIHFERFSLLLLKKAHLDEYTPQAGLLVFLLTTEVDISNFPIVESSKTFFFSVRF